MKTDLKNSTSAPSRLKGSPDSLSRVNVLRGYIHPSD